MTPHFAVSSCDASFCYIIADKSVPWPTQLIHMGLMPYASLAHGEFFPSHEGTRVVFCQGKGVMMVSNQQTTPQIWMVGFSTWDQSFHYEIGKWCCLMGVKSASLQQWDRCEVGSYMTCVNTTSPHCYLSNRC